MNKKRVNQWILPAKEALITTGIYDKEKQSIDKTYRGQIASFGAAVIMGSFKAAVAFFAVQGGASVEREKLIQAMYMIVNNHQETTKPDKILENICEMDDRKLEETKAAFIDASIALKLAMNFFKLDKKE